MNSPSFYDASKVGTLYIPRKAEIRTTIKERKETFNPECGERITLFTIDAQGDFCIPGGSLFVPGAVEDNARLCEFVYRNIERIEALKFTLDMHLYMQIFFPSFWVDKNGNNPTPYEVISYDDVIYGKWMPTREKEKAINYVRQLERDGKYKLTIWEYHTDQGSVGGALVPALTEMVLFHSLLWNTDPEFVEKGKTALSECYSGFGEEVKEIFMENVTQTVGKFKEELLLRLLQYDRIYIAGQASSHCVKATIEDIINYIHSKFPNPCEILQKFYILEDCMSPVPEIPGVIDFPAIAQKAINRFRENGMNVVKSTDAITKKRDCIMSQSRVSLEVR